MDSMDSGTGATQIYIRVSIGHFKAVRAACHPGATDTHHGNNAPELFPSPIERSEDRSTTGAKRRRGRRELLPDRDGRQRWDSLDLKTLTGSSDAAELIETCDAPRAVRRKGHGARLGRADHVPHGQCGQRPCAGQIDAPWSSASPG
jgi:hypothetical protein